VYKFRVLVVLSVFTFLTVGTFVIAQKIGNKKAIETLEPLPKGNGSITFHPYLGDGYLDAPVIVQSVSSKRMEVGKFEIQNISNKAIRAVKVRWNLYEDQDRSKFKQMGQTKLLYLKENLVSEKMGYIKYNVVSFADFYRNYLDTRGLLNKNLDVDVLVDEVIFADGSNWKWEDGKSPDINFNFVESLLQLGDCAKQKCVGRPSTGPRDGTAYSCGPSTLNERCVPDGDYACKNESCNRLGGGPITDGLKKDFEIIIE
jgi:hypothetical protein